MFLSVKTNKLTVTAALTGGLLGVLIFMGAGFIGIAMIAAFFMLGTIATSWKAKLKEQQGFAEVNKGKRRASQVIANAGVAALLGLLIFMFPEYALLLSVMIASSLSSATADTLSSELGNVYGKKFYNIITFKKDIRGLDGVVSLEGTLFGVAGSVIIAIIYSFGFGWNTNFFIIIASGTIGNLSDSVLGASLERKKYLNNDVVNFLNTLVAALAALLFFKLYN
jgi:uncharacterized protein (TIGR00297 family)